MFAACSAGSRKEYRPVFSAELALEEPHPRREVAGAGVDDGADLGRAAREVDHAHTVGRLTGQFHSFEDLGVGRWPPGPWPRPCRRGPRSPSRPGGRNKYAFLSTTADADPGAPASGRPPLVAIAIGRLGGEGEEPDVDADLAAEGHEDPAPFRPHRHSRWPCPGAGRRPAGPGAWRWPLPESDSAGTSWMLRTIQSKIRRTLARSSPSPATRVAIACDRACSLRYVPGIAADPLRRLRAILSAGLGVLPRHLVDLPAEEVARGRGAEVVIARVGPLFEEGVEILGGDLEVPAARAACRPSCISLMTLPRKTSRRLRISGSRSGLGTPRGGFLLGGGRRARPIGRPNRGAARPTSIDRLGAGLLRLVVATGEQKWSGRGGGRSRERRIADSRGLLLPRGDDPSAGGLGDDPAPSILRPRRRPRRGHRGGLSPFSPSLRPAVPESSATTDGRSSGGSRSSRELGTPPRRSVENGANPPRGSGSGRWPGRRSGAASAPGDATLPATPKGRCPSVCPAIATEPAGTRTRGSGRLARPASGPGEVAGIGESGEEAEREDEVIRARMEGDDVVGTSDRAPSRPRPGPRRRRGRGSRSGGRSPRSFSAAGDDRAEADLRASRRVENRSGSANTAAEA